MAFAGLGDAILYPILPIYASTLNIPIIWVGFLLSINKFVRLFSNTMVANVIIKWGMKRVLIIATLGAVLTTFSYGLNRGLLIFIIARLIWGISYSGLKIATLNYAALVPKNKGIMFGVSQSIKSIGALMALWLGPLLIKNIGIQNGLFVFALISSFAVYWAFRLPNITSKITSKVITRKTFAFTPINMLVNIFAISIDGVLVVALASIFNNNETSSAQLLIIVSFYLLLKRLFMVVISFVIGFLTLKIPPLKAFNFSVIVSVVGLFLIAFGSTVLGVVLAFLFNAVIVTFSPLIGIISNHKDNALQNISSVSTWQDLGSGIGALTGLVLIQYIGTKYLFLSLSILIVILFINFIHHNAKPNRTII